MHQRSVVRVGASLIVAALALSACGSRNDSTTGAASGDKIAVIGVMAPLSGDLSALGLGIQHSVELAVKQANANKTIPGWTLKVEAKDDEAKPDVGKNAATAFAGEKNVAGVVGNLNSSVAQSTQPVLATAKIVQVSPANTNPTLTQGADFKTAPKRTYDTYFRTCTTDAIQGPFAARVPVPEGRHHEGRDDPRQEDLRPGSGRGVHHGVHQARRHRRCCRDDQPGRLQLPVRHLQGEADRAPGRLLRRRVPATPVRSRSR